MVRKDFELTKQFRLNRNSDGSFGVVSKRDEFHQAIVTRLHDRLDEITGGFGNDTTKEKMQLAATRVAREHGWIDEISRIVIRQSEDQANTYEMEIVYQAGVSFSKTIS